MALDKIQPIAEQLLAHHLKGDDDWQKTLASAIEQSPFGVIVTDDKGIITYANQRVFDVSGYTPANVLGNRPALFQSGRTGKSVYTDLWTTILSGRTWIGEIENKKKNGDLFWEKVTITPLLNDAGEISHFVAVKEDVTQRRTDQAIKDYATTHDNITGLPNHVLFRDRIHQLINYCEIETTEASSPGFTVVQINILNFRHFNDTLGFATSNQLLKFIASLINEQLAPGESLARGNGARFLLLLPDAETAEAASKRYLDITQVFSQSVKFNNIPLKVNLIGGATLYPQHGDTEEQLLSLSEEALVLAKSSGDYQRLMFVSAIADGVAFSKAQFRAEVSRALEQQEFMLHYQPQVSAVDGRITGCEALIRWHHPDKGLVSPALFIPAAEKYDIIEPIGDWVLETAIKQLKTWQIHLPEGFTLAINLSAIQLSKPGLSKYVEELVNTHKVNPKFLEFEITESSIIANMENSVQLLRELRALGCAIAIDDFGTGYSNLSYLKQIPLDRLKVDRCFVQEMTHIAEDAQLSRLIVQISHTLGLKVVAEGIEDEAQCQLLQRFMCDYLQGFYFSKPVSAEDFLAQLKSYTPKVVQSSTEETLLVVDDEQAILSSIKRLMRKSSYRVLTANTPEEAMDLLAKHSVGVIISDQRMPGMTGSELLRRVKSMYPDTVRIMLSGYTDIDSVKAAVNEGAIYRFFLKPWEDDTLKKEIENAFALYRANIGQHEHPKYDPGI